MIKCVRKTLYIKIFFVLVWLQLHQRDCPLLKLQSTYPQRGRLFLISKNWVPVWLYLMDTLGDNGFQRAAFFVFFSFHSLCILDSAPSVLVPTACDEQRRQGGDTRREESRRQALNKKRHPRFGAVVLKWQQIAYDASYRGERPSPWNAVTTAPYEALHKQWRARGPITLLIILNNWYNVWYERNASVESCSHPWFICSSCRPRLFYVTGAK